VQGFFSVNPKPLDKDDKVNIKSTPGKGFIRIDSTDELYETLEKLIKENKEFFSAMISKSSLGKIIEKANQASTYEEKAEMFLKLLRGIDDEENWDE